MPPSRWTRLTDYVVELRSAYVGSCHSLRTSFMLLDTRIFSNDVKSNVTYGSLRHVRPNSIPNRPATSAPLSQSITPVRHAVFFYRLRYFKAACVRKLLWRLCPKATRECSRALCAGLSSIKNVHTQSRRNLSLDELVRFGLKAELDLIS